MVFLITLISTIFVILEHGSHCDAFLPQFPESVANSTEVLQYSAAKLHLDRIVGGTIVTEKGKFPYQVSIQRYRDGDESGSHFCGGSIISKTCVLCAGHCGKGRKPDQMRICAGATNLKTDCTEDKLIKVTSITVHPKYSSSNIDYDVSIWCIDPATPFEYGDAIKPIEIPVPGVSQKCYEPGSFSTVSGWGTLKEGGDIPDDLYYVDVETVSQEECRKAYGTNDITDRMYCAGNLKDGGVDSCQGDSGGPLVYNGIQCGIVSWGYGCARPAYPGVYTNVQSVYEFIKETCTDYVPPPTTPV